MNKRVLKSYLKNSKKPLLETSCFKYNDKFLISDSYSIILLNDNYDLDIKDDTLCLYNHYENFRDYFEISFTFFKPLEDDEPIDENYEINCKIFNKIKNIIKANSYAVLENKNKDSYMKYIIKLENSKTKEHGYLLPMKRY